MGDLILRSDAVGVSTLSLNRPGKLNALSGALMLELDAHLQALAAATDSIGVVVLRGAGPAFRQGSTLRRRGGRSAVFRRFGNRRSSSVSVAFPSL